VSYRRTLTSQTTDRLGAARTGVVSSSMVAALLRWLVEFARTPGRALEFLRYGGASAAAFAFDTSIYMAFILLGAMSAPIAGALGYASGMVLNYLISVRYIFNVSGTGKSRRQIIVEYVASGIFGIALTFVLISLLTSTFDQPPLLAKLITFGGVFLAIYLLRSGRVFAPK